MRKQVQRYAVDPDDNFEFFWDFTDWLGDDTLGSISVDLPDDLTEVGTVIEGAKLTLLTTGGTRGKVYRVPCTCRVAGNGRSLSVSVDYVIID